MSGPVGRTLESALPTELPLLDGLARLGAKRCEWQGSAIPGALKFQEWLRSSQIFSVGDSTGVEDVTAWVADKSLFPFLSALAGERTVKVGFLITAAAGFLNCPHAVGEMAAAAVLGPTGSAGVSLSVGTKAE